MNPVESDEEDLTRKQRREQARDQRRAIEEADAASAARRTRLTQLASVVVVVVVVVVVILVATGGSGSTKKIAPGSKAAGETAKSVTALVAGIPQSGNALGAPSAPVTLQYFGDLECPICKDFTLGALPALIKKYVRTGKLRIEYLSLQTATPEQEVFRTQQVAALAAGKQNKAWNFIETFYHEQGEEKTGYVTESYLQGIAKQVPGLDLTKWIADRNETALAKEVEANGEAAANAGFNGTPSFFLGRSGGALEKVAELSGADLTKSSAYFEPAIEKFLKK
jgi:protein-disulfide isomerase